MASAETDPPVNSGSSDLRSRTCEICDAQMTHLSDLQPRLFGAARSVFRCYACNHVISEEK
jgi:hypothetical protein